MNKINKLSIGLLFGLILPMLTMSLFYLIKYNKITIKEFFNQLIYADVVTQVISLCVIPNLLLFFLFLQTERYHAARGVIMATFVYTFIIIFIKYT